MFGRLPLLFNQRLGRSLYDALYAALSLLRIQSKAGLQATKHLRPLAQRAPRQDAHGQRIERSWAEPVQGDELSDMERGAYCANEACLPVDILIYNIVFRISGERLAAARITRLAIVAMPRHSHLTA